MKTKLQVWCMVLPALLLLHESALAQQQVTGTVRDASNGDALPGVNVVVKGTPRGTATDLDGRYRLAVASLSDTLIFSFVGFATQEQPIGGRTQIDVNLTPRVLGGEEVVVVGYGTQRKIDLTGAVAIADADQLRQSSSHTLAGALQGKVAGVAVTSSGAPGETPEVRIRGISTFGNNEPLYVIDGVPVDNIMDFNLNDITSVQVLKDAAASAIYGARAANGVVIITTKRGSERERGADRALSVEYTGSVGVSSLYQRWDVLDRQGYQMIVNEALANAGEPLAPGNDPNSPFFIDDIDTDWQEAATEPGMMMQHDFTVSGGNDVSSYSISGGYLGQEGHLQGPGPYFDRYSVRVNSDHRLGRLTFGESAYYGKTHTVRQESRHEVSVINNMVRALPTMPIYDPSRKGGYGGTDSEIEKAIALNVIGVNNLLESTDDADRLLLNLYGQLELLEGLNLRTSFGYDLRESEDLLFVPQFDMGFFFTEQNGTLDQFNRHRAHTLIENTLTYQGNFGRHALNLLGGVTAEKTDYNHVGGHAEGYVDDAFMTLEAATGGKSIYHWKTKNTLQSLLGRVTYNYADRYLMTASVRRDGSSRFGANNRYGTFPSFSLGWRISREPFFNVSFVNDLKLRGSYGQLGNQEIGDYQTAAFINPYAAYNFNNQLAPGAIQVALANADLKWETATSADVGVDATLFDGRLLLTADYYNNKNYDVLFGVPIPTSVGSLANPTVNTAELRNWGYELALTYQNTTSKFDYEVGLNLTTWNNEVLSLGSGEPVYGAASRTEVGGEVGQLYGFLTDGLFQSNDEICFDATGASCVGRGLAFQSPQTAPGDVRFKDLDGNGIVNDLDREYLGSAIPDFYYGLSGRVGYGALDVMLVVQGSYGNKIYNLQRAALESMAGYDNQSVAVLDRWTPQNPDTDMPRAVFLDPNGNARTSDRFVEDGSYLRLQNLTVGYTLPARLLSRMGVQRARVYVTGENLLTLTRYTGYDPDLGDDGDEVDNDGLFSRGFDGGGWPHPRIFRTGVQIGF